MSFSPGKGAAMRVDESNLTAGGTGIGSAVGAQETGKTERGDSARSGASGLGDRVELSSTLTGLSRAWAADGTARASRVASLARAYQSGSYRPDASVTAQGMVSDALAG